MVGVANGDIHILNKGRFDDATSADPAAQCDGDRSDHGIAAKLTNGTPGKGLAGHISEAWPLAFPALCFSPCRVAHAFR
jgi:hypothetical protein